MLMKNVTDETKPKYETIHITMEAEASVEKMSP